MLPTPYCGGTPVSVCAFRPQSASADSSEAVRLLDAWRLESATWVKLLEPEPTEKGEK